MDYDQKLETIIERTTASLYAFWSSMLTAHTVILSIVVTLLTVFSGVNRMLFQLVGVLAIVGMLSLLFNFACTRAQYEIIGNRMVNSELLQSGLELKKDIKRAKWMRMFMRVFEAISTICFILETLLFLWILFKQS